MKLLQVSLAALFLLASAGCDNGMRDSADLLWPDLRNPYVLTTKDWTRHAELRDGIDVTAKASATLKSLDWRKAFVSHYADVYALSDEETTGMLADQMKAHRQRIEVVLAISSPKSEVSELDFRGPMWRIFATRDGNRIYLTEIRSMERDVWPAAKLEEFFPYYERWRNFYTLSFPHTGDGPFTLVIAGPPGEIRFTWPGVDGDV